MRKPFGGKSGDRPDGFCKFFMQSFIKTARREFVGRGKRCPSDFPFLRASMNVNGGVFMFRKKILPITTVILLVAMSLFCFAACNDNPNEGVKSITVYIGEDNPIAVTTEAANLHEVLLEMKESGKISAYEFSESEYGAFITKVGGLALPSGVYYSIWHDIDMLEYKSPYKQADAEAGWYPSCSIAIEEEGSKFVGVKLGNKNLYYSGVGVGSLPVQDGATYAILAA